MSLWSRPGHRRLMIALVMFPLLSSACERQSGRAPHPTPDADPTAAASDRDLPRVGTVIPLLPAGEGRDLAQTHCLACHASEMLLQQRLTERQWSAEVDKMQRWGAEILDADKAALVSYLATRFGPDNDRFSPIIARPEARPSEGAQARLRPRAPKDEP